MDSFLEKFEKYYKEYIGLNNITEIDNIPIAFCDLRLEPINKKYYHSLILTEHNNKIIASIAHKEYEKYIDVLKILKYKIELTEVLVKLVDFEDLQCRYMYRMILPKKIKTSKKIEGYEYEYYPEYRKCLIKYQNEIVSYAKISNVNFGFGNIVVWTNNSHRKKGLGEYVVRKLIIEIRKLKIEPLYLVDSKNENSICLAQKIGFIKCVDEIIIK